MNYIHQYIRNKKNEPVGVVLATKLPTGEVVTGWSKCCKTDKFDKQIGIQIALGRAIKGSSAVLPHQINKALSNMAVRAVRYFKS